jgi:hypothetical protein
MQLNIRFPEDKKRVGNVLGSCIHTQLYYCGISCCYNIVLLDVGSILPQRITFVDSLYLLSPSVFEVSSDELLVSCVFYERV